MWTFIDVEIIASGKTSRTALFTAVSACSSGRGICAQQRVYVRQHVVSISLLAMYLQCHSKEGSDSAGSDQFTQQPVLSQYTGHNTSVERCYSRDSDAEPRGQNIQDLKALHALSVIHIFNDNSE